MQSTQLILFSLFNHVEAIKITVHNNHPFNSVKRKEYVLILSFNFKYSGSLKKWKIFFGLFDSVFWTV